MNKNQRLISFDLKAEMGFLKKPDINDGIYITYNMLHKPALLGILGAIAGLKGYEKNGQFPDYYTRLKNLKLGIQPLNSDKGSYIKDIVSYNNGTGFASNEAGGNLIITEQFLIRPSYRCYLLLDIDNPDESLIYERILSYQAEYLPYLGKNDFSAWWTDAKEYDSVNEFDFKQNYTICSVFAKTDSVSQHISKSMSMYAVEKDPTFIYFEKLPIGFDENLYQYVYGNFVYTNASFNIEMDMSKNGCFYQIEESIIIQLF